MTAGDPGAGDLDEARRQRRAEIFGEVLPESTSDDREPAEDARGRDDELRRNVPPHHG